jgi:hypothetical protein
MSCQCATQMQAQLETPLSQLLPQQLAFADNSSLGFFIQGVKVGMSIRAAEQVKWTRLAVIMGLAFGVITFMKHYNE